MGFPRCGPATYSGTAAEPLELSELPPKQNEATLEPVYKEENCYFESGEELEQWRFAPPK